MGRGTIPLISRKKLMRLTKLFGLISAIALTACGGGGGGGSSSSSTAPVTSTNTFNIQSGFARMSANGFTKTLTVSGSCTGTYTRTDGPATSSTTFEGAAAISGNSVITQTFSNCTPTSKTETVTRYFNANYAPLGGSIVEGAYLVWATPPKLPNAAKVGDVDVSGTINKYTDITKSAPAGKQQNSYVIEADTATTAILNLISKSYDASNNLVATEQDRYRVAADGSLTLISIDVQNANGIHLVMN